jgi:hypothetical protein
MVSLLSVLTERAWDGDHWDARRSYSRDYSRRFKESRGEEQQVTH